MGVGNDAEAGCHSVGIDTDVHVFAMVNHNRRMCET